MKRLLTAAALACTLSAPATAQDASTVLATVNGTDVTLGHLVAMLNRLPEQYKTLPDDTLYQGLLEQIIQHQALADSIEPELATGDQLGLENEMRAFLSGRFIDRAAADPVTDEEVQAAYDAEFANVEPETEYNASHILIETEEEARALKAQLDDGADFAELAREHSTGPSGPNGGQLGWFGAGRMVPEFEEAVVALEDGGISDPIETQFGWHLIILNESREVGAPPLEEVRQQLEQGVLEQRVSAAIDGAVDAADVTVLDVEIDPSIIRQIDLLD